MNRFTQFCLTALASSLLLLNTIACSTQPARHTQTAATTHSTANTTTAQSTQTSTRQAQGTVYTPYYLALTDADKVLYNLIHNAVQSHKKSITIEGERESEDWNRIIEAVYYDHPELISFKDDLDITLYTDEDGSNPVTELGFFYNDLAKNIEDNQRKFVSAANLIIQEAQKFSTPELQIKYVHDTFINTIRYDLNSPNNQSAYSALVSRSTVCAGYAHAFKYIMDQLGIQAMTVSGIADTTAPNQEHSWNIVVLNGKTYNIDITSDIFSPDEDFGNTRAVPKYTYFNRTDAFLKSDNFQRESESDRTLVQLPSCVSQDASFDKLFNDSEIIDSFASSFPIHNQIVKSLNDYYNVVYENLKTTDPKSKSISLDLFFLVNSETTFNQIDQHGQDIDQFANIDKLLMQRLNGYEVSFGISAVKVSEFHYLCRVDLDIN